MSTESQCVSRRALNHLLTPKALLPWHALQLHNLSEARVRSKDSDGALIHDHLRVRILGTYCMLNLRMQSAAPCLCMRVHAKQRVHACAGSNTSQYKKQSRRGLCATLVLGRYETPIPFSHLFHSHAISQGLQTVHTAVSTGVQRAPSCRLRHRSHQNDPPPAPLTRWGACWTTPEACAGQCATL